MGGEKEREEMDVLTVLSYILPALSEDGKREFISFGRGFALGLSIGSGGTLPPGNKDKTA